jgi:hypothetical protein
MRRDLVVVLVVVVSSFVVLAGGLYLIWLSFPGPHDHVVPGVPAEWEIPLLSGLDYLAPVPGPTTPLSSDRTGGLWMINAAREGPIWMDFARFTLNQSLSPFHVGNDSLRLNALTDFQVAPDPAITGPLRSIFYVVPGKNASGSFGPSGRNGAVAFFSGREFVVASPFTKTVFYHFLLEFDPVWTGEDPASAGQMLVQPMERIVAIGIMALYKGPYRYFWASDGTRTAVFEVVYVHESDPTQVPSGRVMFFNGTLTAPPFVYYNQERVGKQDDFRSGTGQAILLPLQNGTMEIANVTGQPRAWIPLALAGQTAVVAGALGFVRSTFPALLYLPLRSATAAGIAALDLASLSFAWEYMAGDPSQVLIGTPVSHQGNGLYLAWYNPGNRTTRMVGLDETGTAIPQFAAAIPGRVLNNFEVTELSEVFVNSEAGALVTLQTTFASSTPPPPKDFPLRPPSNESSVVYAGSPSGTLYGSGLTPIEVYGAWTDSPSAKCALFALLIPPSGTVV